MTDDELRHELLSSFLAFVRCFYRLRTGREFEMSYPPSRESHYITIARDLTDVFHGRTQNQLIAIPPRYAKTELVIHFVAWALAHYGDCNFIYTSYNHTLASKQTHTIRSIVDLPLYRRLFGLELSKDSSARDNFMTTKGGSVAAAGAGGTITGKGAGIRGVRDRFGGCLIMDDMHKPDESTSDTIREGVIEWYGNTAMSRLNEPSHTAQIYIGQATHENDLGMELRKRSNWNSRIIPVLDVHNNPLNPQMHTTEMLLRMKEENPYVFAAQYMQDPQPAGGGIFKPEWFYLTDDEPEMLKTFITVDTAETEKEYNDATVFSFWGIYRIKDTPVASDKYGLHWIDCLEIRVEPKDLESEFMQFYNECNLHKVKPDYAAIEKKSTGTTMLSIMSKYRGIQLIPIERRAYTKDLPAGMLNNKVNRYLMMQPYISRKLVSLPRYGKHTHMCIDHMRKITANNSHRFDDICFVAGTKIATIFGYKNIEEITSRDRVITPFGIRKVKFAHLTNLSAHVIKNIGLIGTPHHPIFCHNQFKPLDTVSDDDKIDFLSFRGLIQWRYRKLLYLMELSTNSWGGRKDIILVNQVNVRKEGGLKDFMWRFGNFIAKRKFQKAMLFITKIITILITTFLIWNVFQLSNILKTIGKKIRKIKNIWINFIHILRKPESRRLNGIKALKGAFGIAKMQKQVSIKNKNLNVEYAQNHSMQMHQMQNTVAKNALENTMQPTQEKEELLKEKVYNLTVCTDGVYYANNVLVSNCDTAFDAVKIALIDKYFMNLIEPDDSDKMLEVYARQLNYSQRLKHNSYG